MADKPADPTPRTWRARLRGLWRDQRGVSAVEFALLSPVLVLGTFATVDAGMAVYDKMMISQVLRAGAQSAIAGQSTSAVQTILEDTAADNFTVATGVPQAGELALSVTTRCGCPDDLSTSVGCATTCSGGGGPTQFYDLSATIDFNGIVLPDFTLSGEMSVMAQ